MIKNITKLMLTLALLVAGVGGANAEKLESNFSEISSAGTNASWDASSKTMTWSSGSYNFLAYTMINGISATDGCYDLSTWETITVTFTLSGNSNQVRIRMKEKDGGDGDWVTMNGAGTHTINITDFKKGGSALNYSKIAGFQLSGGSDNSGSATFSELYLERPDDPLVLPKEELSKKIALAKLYDVYAYTEASFNNLTAEIATAEAALAAAADVESLTKAKDDLQAKMTALKLKDNYCYLTADMLFNWTGWGADAVKGSSAGCAYVLLESTGQPYGDSGVNAFADLSTYNKLVLVSTGGTPRFLLNRDEAGGQWNEDETQSHLIDNTKGGWSAKYFSQEGNVWTVDLAQLVADKGFAHLHAIKANGNVTVSGMYLYDPLLTQRTALSNKIAEASRYSSDFYSTASYNALQDAIAAANAAIVAANATAQSLTDAGDALDAAIAGLQINEGYRELVAEDFFQWDEIQNPTSRTTVNYPVTLGSPSGLPFGDGSVYEKNYANLKQYDKLIVTVTAGTPRFMFNRDVAGGNWNADETQSHLIEYPRDGWSSKYFSNEGNTYIVDLKQMYADKGFVNLNAIKGANWQDVTVTGMYLYRENQPDTYGIIGPLVGGWADTDEKEMTEDLMGIYTYTFTGEFQATEASYDYKLRSNSNWDGYQLPAQGQGNETWIPKEVGGYYNLTVKADVLTNSLDVEAVPVPVAHTATFTTNLDWEDVYAFVWTEGKKSFLGDWPGTKLEASEGVYTVSFNSTKGGVDPEQIIFNNGKTDDAKEQTSDLAFEDNKAYTWNLNYYVMSEDFFGSWDASEAQKMTKNTDGTYTLNMEGKALSSDKEYKVMKDLGGNTTWYPDGDNKKIEIKMDATYDIAITFNPANSAISEAMSVYKTISDAGYATYCVPYALNFEGTGVKAYFAKKEEGNNVKFYEIFNAPANTGLLLKADAETYKLKMEAVTGEAAANVDGNVLHGVLVNTQAAAGSFVLLNGAQGVGFYKTINEFTVGANTAYIDAIAGARSFIALDNDETTAIEGITVKKTENAEIYNLQGQRVMNAKKGLYIINGKKVVVK